MPFPSDFDKILFVISAVRDDEEKLQRILAFLESEILPDIEEIEIKIPEKYEALVYTIADRLSAGLTCYLNMDSPEVVDYPANVDVEEWESVTGEKLEPLHLQWKNVVSFEPLDSSESFRIMEDFVMQITDAGVQETLMDILSKRKPFAHFNSYIHQSKYRKDWFKFRSAAYEKQVRETIFHQLNSDR